MFRTVFKSSLSFKTTALLALGLVFSSPQTWGAGGASPQTTQKPVLTTLHRFDGTHGANPTSALTLGSDGSFYGVTNRGGSNDSGTIYKMTPDGHFTTLFQFDGKNGTYPSGVLVQGKDGAFYGTTAGGGAFYAGTVFRVTPAGHLTTLHNFNDADGSVPVSPLAVAPDGSLYGATAQRGAAGQGAGTVFHISLDGAFTTLHTFFSSVLGGISPVSGIVLGPDGALYGTTEFGPGGPDDRTDFGSLFRLTTGGAFSVLHVFTGPEGRHPFSSPRVGSDGALYGVTYKGGIGFQANQFDSGAGVAYRITLAGQFTLLHKFSDDGHGDNPIAALILGADGSFYGTTRYGGTQTPSASSGAGTVFQMTPAGQVTTLYKFHTAFDGSNPTAGVVFGPDGALYGTTSRGGTNGYGTIYKMTLP